MRRIDSYFYFEPQVPLHHYTGIQTLLALAPTASGQKQPCLWSSHVSYLNDSQEILYAREVMRYGAIPAMMAFGHPDDMWFAEEFGKWIDITLAAPFNMFVFSLSEEPNLLSQWRSYTPHGKGVSISFSTELVREIAHVNKLKIGKCLYNHNEQRDLITSLIESLWITYRNLGRGNQDRADMQRYFTEYRHQILQVLALIKHEAFKEEAEWRLISNVDMDPALIHFRQAEGAALLTPYIELTLPIKDFKFQSITLGPTPHGALSFAALQAFAAKTKLSANIYESEIPFRRW
jgi:hypothetical protein